MGARKKADAAAELLEALGNPVRRQVMRRMRDEPVGLSPRELADEFDLPVSNMAYHVRVLAGCGALRLVRTQPVRGAVKHYYRSSVREPWAQQIIELEPWNRSWKRPSRCPRSQAR